MNTTLDHADHDHGHTQRTQGSRDHGSKARRADADAQQASRPIPFTRLVAVELRKLLDTRAGVVFLGAIVVLSLLSLAGAAVLSRGTPSMFSTYLGAATLPFDILLPVLGILAGTAEFTRRAGLMTFTLEPRRVRVALAKAAAAVVLGLVCLAVAFLAAALVTLALGSDAVMPRWDVSAWALAGRAAASILFLLMGVGLGLLLTNTALAIVVFFVAPLLLQSLQLSQLTRAAVPWLDLTSATDPLTQDAALTATQIGQLTTAAGLWVVLPLALGTWLLTRREVK